jgi:uncharacterized protein YidB (DUF937 family)
MNDLGSILSGLTSGGGLELPKLIEGVQGVFAEKGGVDGLIKSLREGGLGGVVDSWISTGSNQPVEPAKLGQALGPDTVNELSANTGISIESLLPLLAAFLPQIIDFLTPGGNLPEEGGTGSMGDIGDVIGNVLGSGGLGDLFGGKG